MKVSKIFLKSILDFFLKLLLFLLVYQITLQILKLVMVAMWIEEPDFSQKIFQKLR
jgi:hypothetical protein